MRARMVMGETHWIIRPTSHGVLVTVGWRWRHWPGATLPGAKNSLDERGRRGVDGLARDNIWYGDGCDVGRAAYA